MARQARPYARAIFEHAVQSDTLSVWSEQLQRLELVLTQPSVQQGLSNPQKTREDKQAWVRALLADLVIDEALRLVMLWMRHGRVGLVSDVRADFEQRWAAHRGVVPVTVVSPYALGADHRSALQSIVEAQLQCRVCLSFEQNPDLVAGVVVRCGDRVWDASLQGASARLRRALCTV